MLQKEFENSVLTLIKGKAEGKTKGKRFLLAVSGGIDSMCMAALFNSSPWDFSLAHMNFSLRGEDSDGDELLVRQWAESRGVRFYSKTVDTKGYAREFSISTQMAARDLRYNWFEEILSKHDYDYVCVAHNKEDNVETLFINLLRGTGIKGLSGINPVNDKVIRPILSISRDSIQRYMMANSIEYRNDMSNYDSDYTRNRIRNVIFPEFRKINPSFVNTLDRSMCYFAQATDILDELFLAKKDLFSKEMGDELEIFISALKRESHLEYWLYKMLSEKGFNASQIEQVVIALDGQTGKIFRSFSYELLLDRGVLKVYPISDYQGSLEILEAGSYEFNGFSIRLDFLEKKADFNPISTQGQLFMDADNMVFPIICRTWKIADKFRPLGMRNGFKKLSDFYIDLKISKRDKDRLPVLESGGGIICIPGLRIDDRYRVSASTRIVAQVIIVL